MPGRDYVLQNTGNLCAPNWTNILEFLYFEVNPGILTVRVSRAESPSFYRALAIP